MIKKLSSVFKNASAGMKESYAHDQEIKKEKEEQRYQKYDFKTTSGRHNTLHMSKVWSE